MTPQSIKLYVIRVLEIDFDGEEFRYFQLERNKRYGPFPSLSAMLSHIQDSMLEDIDEEIIRQRH